MNKDMIKPLIIESLMARLGKLLMPEVIQEITDELHYRMLEIVNVYDLEMEELKDYTLPKEQATAACCALHAGGYEECRD